MKFTTKLCMALVGILVCLAVFYSCKKNDTNTVKEKELEERSIALIKEKIRTESPGISTIYYINDKITFDYYDKDGNKVLASSPSARSSATDNCSFEDQNGDPVDAPYTIPPAQVVRRFDCGSGYKYTIEYIVSSPVPLTQSNPYFPSVVSKGSVRLKKNNTTDNTTANVVYLQDNIPVTLVLLGDDPNDPNRYMYRCTFTTAYIQHSTVVDGPYIEPRATFATTCNLFASTSQGPITRYLVWGSQISPNGQPCSRTDKCFINPSDPSNLGSIAGSDVLGICAANGITVSQFHDFEYRVITGFNPNNWATTGTPGTWQIIPITSSTGAPPSNPQGTLGYWDVSTLPATTFPVGGVFEFRYRNRMTSGTGAPCTGSWSEPERYKFY